MLVQEDEIASNALSCGRSPYLQIAIMTRFETFRPFFSFGEDCDPEDLDRWRSSFLFFLKKLSYKNQSKPLVVKSPVHTARIPLLLEMFPQAKFVYCHRSPYEVFQSAIHMASSYYPYCYLNKVNNEVVLDFVLQQYELLYETYVRDRLLIDGSFFLLLSSFCFDFR